MSEASGEAAADEPDFNEIGRKLFAQECDFLWAASSASQLPPPGAPEIAFAGRSNVGKSSLLNALTNRKTLARTSHTPGRTRELNFFGLGGDVDTARLRLVDMPGYGYAAASKQKIASWTDLMRDFLRGRASLLRVFVLVDGRHGLKPVDAEMMDLLDRSAMSYQIVLTKRDEVKAAELDKRVEETLKAIEKRPAAFPQVIFTSSQSFAGIPDLRAGIARLMAERGF
ncbi:putative GTP-binding protein EngB [Methylocella tundrae]|uniref:Probable GTP-binding protein EngB n=1 Tax=Methylocella tundrae TaxID=227605 RepID=A0A8B6M4R4_METTU|nr:ribosome biogenesis GTP-binding protein YihA/YsxC [Methylocella tundrae]VTZ49102.1 putative GTP-binding protein EngB [Methylocella tundrae]